MAVRFEARIWREATTGVREERQPDYTFKDVAVNFPAEWAVYGINSGVRVKYCSTSQEAAEAYAAKWNGGKVPEDVDAKDESAAYLKTIIKPGDEVKTILRRCSRSGMSRRISLVIAVGGDVQDITWHAARAMGEKVKQGGQWVQDAGLVVGGCGMDMGFHVVYNLGRCLYPDGFSTDFAGRRCRNCHTDGDARNYTCSKCGAATVAGYSRNGPVEFDTDGGYALKQRWL